MPSRKLGTSLPMMNSTDAHRRRQQRLDGAALPLARHDKGGEQRPDHHLDQRDRARHQEPATFQLGVEPEARLDIDRRRHLLPRAQRALRQPGRPRPLHIAGDEARGVGVAAIGDHLDAGGVAARQPLREVAGEHDDAVEAPGGELVEKRAPVGRALHLEEAGVRQRSHELVGLRRRLLGDDADAHAGGVEGDAEAEQGQEEGRQDEGDDEARRVAHDLQGLLAHQCPDATQAASARPGLHAACSRSWTSMRPMKASSRVGVGSSGVLTRACRASGASIAITWPR